MFVVLNSVDSGKMRFEMLVLFIVCLFISEGKENEENEVLDKGVVMVRFPSYLYEVPKKTLRKTVVQKRFKGRNIVTSVEPMEGKFYIFEL